MNQPSSIICICGHPRNHHSSFNEGGVCHQSGCPCYQFLSTLTETQTRIADEAEQKRLQDLNDEYRIFVKRNRCPKCGFGTHPQMEYHSKKKWYQTSCQLGLRTEHIHLICDLCKAHYDAECLSEMLKMIKGVR